MLIRVNGRSKYFDHLSDFRRVGPGKYTVQHHGVEFQIEGGKHAGGSRNQWFVDTAEWTKPIYTTSVMDSLDLLEKM